MVTLYFSSGMVCIGDESYTGSYFHRLTFTLPAGDYIGVNVNDIIAHYISS